MKLTKALLRTIIKEEISRMDEIFGFGKKGKTVTVNTGMNFPPMHRFLSGIQLSYDKSKDAFVGKGERGGTRVFKNLPGRDYQGRNFDGVIYAIAFKKMFGKDAPEPKSAAAADTEKESSGDSSGPVGKIARALKLQPNQVKIEGDKLEIIFVRPENYKLAGKTQAYNQYFRKGPKVAQALRKAGLKNARFAKRFDTETGFGLFTI